MPPQIIAFFLSYWKHLAAIAVLLFCGWKIYSWGYDNAEAKCNESRQELRNAIADEKKRREDTVAEYEKKLLEAKPVKETVIKEVIKEVEKPIYRECKLPDTGVATIKSNAERLNALRKEGDIDTSAWKTLREKFKSEK